MSDIRDQALERLQDKRKALEKLRNKAEIAQSQIDVKIASLKLTQKEIEMRESEEGRIGKLSDEIAELDSRREQLNNEIESVLASSPDDVPLSENSKYKSLNEERSRVLDAMQENLNQIKRVYYGRA